MVDSRVEQPARQAIEDLAQGELDAALVWGPIAGYWAERQATPIKLVPLTSDPRSGLRLDFRISMGMRANEPLWKHTVNDLIRELQPQIQAILLDYGVPLLDEQGRLITAEPGAEPPVAASTVPEPDGYRMDKYRAAVPATLKGASVLSTSALRQPDRGDGPVLVDVLPKTRKPADRDQAQLWLEPAREHLPGSVWLPNVGYGELTPEYADYFRTELARLTGRRPRARGLLLRQQLLDVLERRQAGDGGTRLHGRLLVPRRRTGLEEGRQALVVGARGADAGLRAIGSLDRRPSAPLRRQPSPDAGAARRGPRSTARM